MQLLCSIMRQYELSDHFDPVEGLDEWWEHHKANDKRYGL